MCGVPSTPIPTDQTTPKPITNITTTQLATKQQTTSQPTTVQQPTGRDSIPETSTLPTPSITPTSVLGTQGCQQEKLQTLLLENIVQEEVDTLNLLKAFINERINQNIRKVLRYRVGYRELANSAFKFSSSSTRDSEL